MAFIRAYKETDFEACARICIETLMPKSLASSPAAAKLAPYLWTHPYTFLSPSTSHVLDDGTGNAVGYCIGCPDINIFIANYESYRKTILSRDVERPQFATCEPWITESTGLFNPLAIAQHAYRPEWSLVDEAVRWRATMHIDILPPWQGRGWGRRLVQRFVDTVRSSGQNYDEGIHIGVAGENSKVVPFYQKLGFVLVDRGEGAGSITMTKNIDKV
ncbi:hypothetical protein GGS20DRAFT_206018 [Poronia punctata]|nr:hypothetical protein GGS20DRAFT_206018 [Poronia punctata]